MVLPQLTIREEQAGDHGVISHVVTEAFPSSLEARLVEELRRTGNLSISLVAMNGADVVGHIAFSPVSLEHDAGAIGGLGLAPVAVLPGFRNRGIGAALVQEGLRRCRESGAQFVVVLGEPHYYRRFGFRPASGWGIGNEYGVGDEFMAMELRAGALAGAGGVARYGPEFSSIT